MKTVVLKIGARISYGKVKEQASINLFDGSSKSIVKAVDKSGGNGEAKSVISLLTQQKVQTTILTKMLDNEYVPKEIEDIKDILTLDKQSKLKSFLEQFDNMVVLNGNFNCFGGAEESIELDLANYKAINLFKGPVFYCLCDPALLLRGDIFSSVKTKPWGNKYNKEDYNITRDDIRCIVQAFSTSSIYEEIKKTTKAVQIKEENIFHFPFEKFPLMSKSNFFPVEEQPEFDLLYGGTMRGNRRVKKLVKFYYGYSSDLKVQLFGKMDPTVLEREAQKQGKKTSPEFSGSVNYSDFCKKMHKSLAHIVIGDQLYENSNDVPQRAYESIAANVVTFIDKDIDTMHRVYGSDEVLSKFMYVSDSKDAEEKITKLKNDKSLRADILSRQKKIVESFDISEFCKDFVKILENHSRQ